MGRRLDPNQSIFSVSAASKRVRCLASRLERVRAPIFRGSKAFTVSRPPAAHARSSARFTSDSPMASGEILARATASPASTGWRS